MAADSAEPGSFEAPPADLNAGDIVLVSACILGHTTRYNGEASGCAVLVAELQARGAVLVPICPEVLGGLPVPRPAAEPTHGTGEDVLDGASRILDREGVDVTDAFLQGAQEVVRLAERLGARWAWLEERSPSCGVAAVHSGGEVVPGRGVAAAALARAGVRVFSCDS